jgi:hypothetical protein
MVPVSFKMELKGGPVNSTASALRLVHNRGDHQRTLTV